MSYVDTIGSIYQMFGSGDVPGILELIANDVAWESWESNSAQAAGVPSMQARTGKAEVADFFAVAGSMKITDFQVLNLMAGGNEVAATIVIECGVPGGGTFRDEEIHLWTFNDDGKVCRLRHYIDTAKQIAAWKG